MESKITENENFMFTGGVDFKKLRAATRNKTYLTLEEAKHEFWTWGRIVCAGDSIHKMTPNVSFLAVVLKITT